MVSCTYCGLNVPRSEAAVTPEKRYFCSDEHLLKDRGEQGAGGNR